MRDKGGCRTPIKTKHLIVAHGKLLLLPRLLSLGVFHAFYLDSFFTVLYFLLLYRRS